MIMIGLPSFNGSVMTYDISDDSFVNFLVLFSFSVFGLFDDLL